MDSTPSRTVKFCAWTDRWRTFNHLEDRSNAILNFLGLCLDNVQGRIVHTIMDYNT